MKVQDKHTTVGGGGGEIQRSGVLDRRSSIGISVAVGICGISIGRLEEPSSKSTISCWNPDGDTLHATCHRGLKTIFVFILVLTCKPSASGEDRGNATLCGWRIRLT